jgi:DNA-binding MarR family transcriptional regulator
LTSYVRAAELHHLARRLRAIALDATGNAGADRVNAGELAVLEDVALHPGATIGDVTRRTGLAQSLVSRIVRTFAVAGALTVEQDAGDRRKVAIELTASTRETIVRRASSDITAAVALNTPALDAGERQVLEHHLSEAAALLRRATPSTSGPA